MSSTRTSFAWISSALSALVVSINLTVMSVAFDSLRRDFPGTELSVMGWVLSVYTIVFGALLVPAGRLADHLGRRTIFLWGLGIMSVSSTLAGLAGGLGDHRRPGGSGRGRRVSGAVDARPLARSGAGRSAGHRDGLLQRV